MHLGALLALGAIVACAVSAFWRRAQGTAVEDGRRRVGRAAGGQPQKCPEIVDHRLEDASREPPTGLLVDGLPCVGKSWGSMRQEAPARTIHRRALKTSRRS